jgi:Tol biopolymer transport system component
MDARTTIGSAIWVAIAIAGALMTPAPAQATFAGENGKIAFVRVASNENGELHVVNADGTGLKRLTDHSTFSNDNTYDGGAAWSPDGRKILFVGVREYGTDIYTINPDGTGETNLTRSPSLVEWGAEWSPDGTRIAFMGCVSIASCGISTMTPDGSDRRDLLLGEDGGAIQPVWSPDGSQIAYQQYYYTPSGLTLAREIHIMNSDGSDRRRLTDDGTYAIWGHGSRIAFWRQIPYGNGAVGEIFTIRADGTGETRLTYDLGSYPFAWSPDGARLLVFGGPHPGGLFTVRADGGALMRLGDSATSAAWSPDGTKVVAGGLRVINADGSGETRVTQTPNQYSDDSQPAWQPLVRSSFKNAPAFCRAQREAAGPTAFAARYGGKKSSFSRCIKER